MENEEQKNAILALYRRTAILFYFHSFLIARLRNAELISTLRCVTIVSPRPRSISIKLSTLWALTIIWSREESFQRSINLHLNLFFSRKYVARNPWCFFQFMANVIFERTALLRKQTLIVCCPLIAWQLLVAVDDIALLRASSLDIYPSFKVWFLDDLDAKSHTGV